MTGFGKRVRRSLLVGSALSVILATAAWAAVTWADPTVEHPKVGPKWTWNYGSSMGATDDGQLQEAYVTDFVKGLWASDAGPFEGVYAMTGAVDGGTGAVTWTKGKRISPATFHSDRSALTTAGDHVYVTYVKVASYDAYDPADPRVTYIRVNTSNGLGTAWVKAVKLSTSTGRVDYPVPAAAGSNVYVVWTNSANGKITLARSTSNGAAGTFANSTLGTVTRLDTDDPAEGYGGWPGICADGQLVGVAWLQDTTGSIKARTSTDGGATFNAAVTLEDTGGGLDNSWPQCDAYDPANDGSGDIAFTWSNRDKVLSNVFSGGTAGSDVTVYDYDGTTYNGGYGPTPEWSPDGTDLGVAFTACKPTSATPDCDYYSNSARVDLMWAESTDGGGTFGGATLLATKSVTRKNASLNDYPSVVWYDADTRYISYNVWLPSYARYQLHLQMGNGTP